MTLRNLNFFFFFSCFFGVTGPRWAFSEIKLSRINPGSSWGIGGRFIKKHKSTSPQKITCRSLESFFSIFSRPTFGILVHIIVVLSVCLSFLTSGPVILFNPTFPERWNRSLSVRFHERRIPSKTVLIKKYSGILVRTVGWKDHWRRERTQKLVYRMKWKTTAGIKFS